MSSAPHTAPPIDALRDDLVGRWRAAFGRYAEVTDDVRQATESVYTEYPAYALEGWSAKRFKPGARVAKTPTPGGAGYAFDRDAKKRPLRVRYSHPQNGVDWRGTYFYRDDEIEHLEYCIQSGVPNLYGRLLIAGADVLAEQRFVANAGGHYPAVTDLDAAEAADWFLSDPSHYFIYVTRYQLDAGLVVSAEELHEVGGAVHRPSREYAYEAGKLQRIVQLWPNGERRTLYQKR